MKVLAAALKHHVSTEKNWHSELPTAVVSVGPVSLTLELLNHQFFSVFLGFSLGLTTKEKADTDLGTPPHICARNS